MLKTSFLDDLVARLNKLSKEELEYVLTEVHSQANLDLVEEDEISQTEVRL